MYSKCFMWVLAITFFVFSAVAYAEKDDALVIFLGDAARKNITKVQLPDDSFIPPETPIEKAKPILPFADMKRVVHHGMRSDMMEVCGLNWKDDYLSFMASERSKKIWSAKQMGYMGLLHGVAMGFFDENVKKRGCTSEMKSAFQKAKIR